MIRTVSLEEVRVEKSVYPRLAGTDWRWVENIKEAMLAECPFPPIVAADVKELGKNVLIDGMHRLAALKALGKMTTSIDHLGTISIIEAQSEAISRNAKHGRPLSFYDKIGAMRRLKEEGLSFVKIGQLLSMRGPEIERLCGQRLVSTTTGREIILPSSLSHFRGQTLSKEDAQTIDEIRPRLDAGDSQKSLLEQIIILTESGFLDLQNEEINELANRLYFVLTEAFQKNPKVVAA
jgi:hypothetical protein